MVGLHATCLNDIFIDACFAPKDFERPGFCQRAHPHLRTHGRACSAQGPALLLAECRNVQASIQKICQQSFGNVRRVRLIGTVELIHEDVDQTQG